MNIAVGKMKVQKLIVPYLPLSSPHSAVAASVKRSLSVDDSTCSTDSTEIKIEQKEELTDILRSLTNGAAFMEDAESLVTNEVDNNNKGDVQESTIVVNKEVAEEQKPEKSELDVEELEQLKCDEELSQMLQDLRSTCPVCERKFRYPSRMRRHMTIHSSERNFKCSVCQIGFKTLTSLQYHELTHRAVKPFKCSICLSTHCTKSALRKHIENKHGTGKKHVACGVCGKKFMDKPSLKKHILRHAGKNILCTVCGHMFYTEKDLRIHIAKVHDLSSKDAPEVYQCSHCNRTYGYKPYLVNHMLSAHLKVRRFECAVCGKTFAVKARVQQHLECHLKMKFFCKCGRSFTSKPSLDRHSLTHVNYRPYTCAMCGLTFTQKSSIERHIVTNMEKEHFKRTGMCKPVTGGRGGFYALEEY